MKKNLMTITAAALITMCAGVASAQDRRTSMKVPVAFRTATATMPDGQYYVSVSTTPGGVAMVHFQNRESGKQVMAVAMRSQVAGAEVAAQLNCTRSACYVESFTSGATKYTFSIPKMTAHEKQQLYTVLAPADPARHGGEE